MKKINKKGFTLVELLVVVSIIGLLSTLAVVALGSARVKARDAKRVSDIKQIQTALELYYSDYNEYPQNKIWTGTVAAGSYGVVQAALLLGDSVAATGAGGLNEKGFVATATTPDGTIYMSRVPEDPSPHCTGGGVTDFTYVGSDGAGGVCGATGCASYTITFCLEGISTGLAPAGDHTATPSGVR